MSDFYRSGEHLAMCSEDAYRVARSACIQFGMQEIESSVIAGVETAAVNLGANERRRIANDLLCRLYGQTEDELIEEQRLEQEQEEESLAKMFSHE